MGLDEILHWFGDSPHSCLVCRSQLLIRFEFEPPWFRALALLPPTRFYCGTMQNGTGWKSALIWDSPHSCLVCWSQLLIRFPQFWALALLPPTRFNCGTLQNGTGWNSALIWDSPHGCLVCRSQLLIRFEFEPPQFRALAHCPQLDFIVELWALEIPCWDSPHQSGEDFPFEFCGTMQLPPTRFYWNMLDGWNSALIWGFPAQLPSL